MRALVVGGTGPTGPFIVQGLLDRGFEVTILHRGNHEIDDLPEVEHIHTDPHFRESLAEALTDRTFDLTIATYGRLKYVAEVLVGKTSRFIGVGGTAYRGMLVPGLVKPRGAIIPIHESQPVIERQEEHHLGAMMTSAKEAMFGFHPTATYFAYPYVYGPHQLIPREWSIIRRVLDRRPFIVLPDGGFHFWPHGYAENVARAVLLAVDNPGASSGKTYNCTDEQQLSLRQIVEVVCAAIGGHIEILSVPMAVASVAHSLLSVGEGESNILDIRGIREDLGYSDAVPAVEAFARTARWLMKNQPERGGQLESSLGDHFDYAKEDRLAKAYLKCLDTLQEFRWDQEPVKVHPYPHPKKLGEADHRGR